MLLAAAALFGITPLGGANAAVTSIRVSTESAFRSAIAHAAPGATIYVSAGRYMNVGVRITKPVRTVGDTGVVFDGGGRTPTAFEFTAGSRGSQLLNVTVTNYRADTSRHPGMVIVQRGASDLYFGFDSFVHSHSHAMYVAGQHVMITNSHFDDNDYDGINGDGAAHLTVLNSTFNRNNLGGHPIKGSTANAAGVKLVRSFGINVQWSTFSNNNATGLWCDLGCDSFVVQQSTASNNANHGFFYEISTKGRLNFNTAIGNRGYGIELSSATHTIGVGNRPNVHSNRAGQIVIKCSDPRHACGDNHVS